MFVQTLFVSMCLIVFVHGGPIGDFMGDSFSVQIQNKEGKEFSFHMNGHVEMVHGFQFANEDRVIGCLVVSGLIGLIAMIYFKNKTTTVLYQRDFKDDLPPPHKF